MDLSKGEYFVHLHKVGESNVLVNKFPYPITLEGNWEIGLLELSMSQNFSNVPDEEESLTIVRDGATVTNIMIPGGRYEKLNTYMESIRKGIAKKAKDLVKMKVDGGQCTFTFLKDGVELFFSERAGEHLSLTDDEVRDGLSVDYDETPEDDDDNTVEVFFDPWANMRRLFVSTRYISKQLFQNSTNSLLGSCLTLNGYANNADAKIALQNNSPIYFRAEVNVLEEFSVQLLDEKGRHLPPLPDHAYALIHIKKS